MMTLTGQPPLGEQVAVCSPLYATPRNPARPTLGHLATETACRLGKPLYPWQQEVADVALEVDPDTGQLVYSEVVLTVPRQAGKTTFVLILMIARLTAMSQILGLQSVIYTAQTGTAAREKLSRDFAKALRVAAPAFVEIPPLSRLMPRRPHEWKLSMNNGSEHIRFGIGNYLAISAPTDDAGHGSTLDMGAIDEAFAHKDDIVEQGIEPTMQTRDSPQMYVFSTAGDAGSHYLWRKVVAGRKRCQTGDHGNIAYFEWGVPDDADWTDENVWRRHHPNVSNPNVLRYMRAKLAKALENPDDPLAGINAFRRGYCNQWVDPPKLTSEARPPAIPVDEWTAIVTPSAVARHDAPTSFGFAASLTRSQAFIVAAQQHGERIFLEVVDARSGCLWLPGRARDIVQSWGSRVSGLVVDRVDPAAPEIGEVKMGGQKVLTLSSDQFAAACVGFAAKVHEGVIVERGDPEMHKAIEGLRFKRLGVLQAVDRAACLSDPAVAVAAICAVAGLPVLADAPKRKPFVF